MAPTYTLILNVSAHQFFPLRIEVDSKKTRKIQHEELQNCIFMLSIALKVFCLDFFALKGIKENER